jgi:AbiTii
MKLLDETIALLSGEKPNLTDALMKTKLLLHKLGRKDLAGWVNQELTGYDASDRIPDYRILHATVKCNAASIGAQFTGHPLPTMHLDEKVRARFEELDIRDSISTIEELARTASGRLTMPIPMEANHLFEKALRGGVHVQMAWSEIGHGQVTQILTQVRSRLLDFLLELDEKVEDDMSDEEVKRLGQRPDTASMFNNAIFGDNATIVVGNQNRQMIFNRIHDGDFDALATLLKQNNVPVAEIKKLQSAIDLDKGAVELEKQYFGPKVQGWMKHMLGNAVDTSWTIEVAIAANLLTDALKAYYGWLLP